MVVQFYKSLDRPLDILGLRGKWITLFLCCVGASVFLAFVAAFFTSAGVGIATAICLSFVSFFVCMIMQQKVSYRRIDKYTASKLIYPCVYRRETLTFVLLPDPRDAKGKSSDRIFRRKK